MAQNNYNWPINPTTVNSGPIQYTQNGSPVTVNIDTGTPVNSTPLPVRLYDSSGNILAFNNDYGASAGALRTAAQIGNTTGQADFDAGATGAQTLRVEANQGAAGGTPWPVTGPLTDAQLRATPVPTSAAQSGAWAVSVSNFPATQPVSGTVAIDQTTPGTTNGVVVNSSALPTGAATETTLSAMSAKLPATLGQKTSANSLAVVVSSDQSAIPVSPTAGATGNSPGSSTVSTVATITAPANAMGFILMNLDTSTTNMRYRIGATAATNSGQQLQPGRDTGFIPCSANISIIAESGTCNYDIQWVVK